MRIHRIPHTFMVWQQKNWFCGESLADELYHRVLALCTGQPRMDSRDRTAGTDSWNRRASTGQQGQVNREYTARTGRTEKESQRGQRKWNRICESNFEYFVSDRDDDQKKESDTGGNSQMLAADIVYSTLFGCILHYFLRGPAFPMDDSWEQEKYWQQRQCCLARQYMYEYVKGAGRAKVSKSK